MNRILLAIVSLTLAGPVLGRTPIVFVHGFKGATLVDKEGSVKWLSALQALAVTAPDLRLRPGDALRPGGVLRSVRFIPLLAEFPVYGRWLEAAEKSGRPFHPFAYDWRKSLDETVARLEHFIEAIGGKVLVVAHSMGGLVTFSLLNRRPELFSGAVFAGVPFAGGISFMPDLHGGTKNGLNGRILGPEVVGTFPSVYTLFADDTDALTGSLVSLRDVAVWKRLQLGPFAPGRTPTAEQEAFLSDAFRRAKEFRTTLVRRDIAYPPIATVVASHVPTLARGIAGGPKAVLGWDFESAPREAGDGRVRLSSMAPPVPHETMVSTREHAELLDEPAVQVRIFGME